MTDNLKALTARYTGWPVILDSNLLLLRWCGALDVRLLKTFKRVSDFDITDIYLLEEVLSRFGAIETTPHVLTEVSNLANALPSWKRAAWAKSLIEQISPIKEIWESASIILQDHSLAQFGLTDAAIGRLAKTHMVVTIDWRLSNFLVANGLAAINFRSIRMAFQ